MEISINGRLIGPKRPAYLVAEMSANHGQSFENAVAIISAAKSSGADAIKIQTYTADTMTLAGEQAHFKVQGTIWDQRKLHELYQEAQTPWEWQPKLKEIAEDLGLHFFSSPFDASAVDFLEKMEVPVYKIASFELVDFPLLRRVAATGKPVIVSTGMASVEEISEAVEVLRESGCKELVLLKCTSAYPAPIESMNLMGISFLQEKFSLPIGLSDHSLSLEVPIAARALGACVIEKHFTLSRNQPGPDSAFSLEPVEFRAMADAVRMTEKALGSAQFGTEPEEAKLRAFRRSLFVVENVKQGETLTEKNVRAIRPGNGMHTRYLDRVLGLTASRDIAKGTPLSPEVISNFAEEPNHD